MQTVQFESIAKLRSVVTFIAARVVMNKTPEATLAKSSIASRTQNELMPRFVDAFTGRQAPG